MTFLCLLKAGRIYQEWGSALIRIHGGAWVGGDKGFANMMQVNKYFAAQGYTVFDVQYGLTDLVDLTIFQPYLARMN